MRIISKYKDYYDRAVFHDEGGKVWIRNEEEVPDKRAIEIARGFLNPSFESMDVRIKKRKHLGAALPIEYGNGQKSLYVDEIKEYELRRQRIVFCGRIYTCLVVEERWTYSRHTFRFWRDGQLEHNYELEADMPRGRWLRRSATKLKDAFYDQGCHDDKALNLCLELQTPTLYIDWSTPRADRAHLTLVKNPKLEKLGFFRMFNAPQAAQELSMFVDGVMTTPDTPEPVTDKVKIQAHGMDERSFRKDPTKVHH